MVAAAIPCGAGQCSIRRTARIACTPLILSRDTKGKSRLGIMDPSMTIEKEMRTQHPFLCLCFATLPPPSLGSNFQPRAEPCAYAVYDRSRKSYAVLTIPNLYVRYTLEVKFVRGAFPLRVTNHLVNHAAQHLPPPQR